MKQECVNSAVKKAAFRLLVPVGCLQWYLHDGIAIDQEALMAREDTATLSSRFQISIPKSIRAARSWHAGQRFAFIPKGEGMLLVPVPAIEDLAGIARGASPEGYRDRTDRV